MGDYEVTQYPSLLRSEHMTLVQLFCPIDVAHATVEALGDLERIQFKDLNPDVNPFQRTYVSQIRRCDEAERRLRFLTQQIASQGIHIRPASETLALLSGRSGPQALDDLDSRLSESESRVQAMNTSFENLEKRALELEEARQVLRETERFFLEAQGGRGAPGDYRASFEQGEMEAPLLGDVEHAGPAGGAGDAAAGGFELEFVAGTIDRSRMATFERVLWRVLRGNLYMNSAEIADDVLPVPSTMQGTSDSAGGEEKRLRKNAFVIFAHGQDLLDKIRKIAESMGATLFAIDSSSDKRSDKLREVTSRIEDLHSVLYNTNQTRRAELLKIADSISAWWALVRKEKVVFATLNMWLWDQGRKTLVAEGWVPTRDIPQVQAALRRASENAGTSVSALLHELRTTKTPPTFHRTNKFTEGFQNIIDAYGIGSYQEVNPGLFTVITFPFLFAVMFGDIGHGALMMLSALVLIALEKKFGKKGMGSEILDTFYFGRYIIFLMGAFAIYTGIMYNDIFSLSLRLGPSQWRWPDEGSAGKAVEAIQTSSRYWIGLDPGWHGAENALIFTNSLKMKMSIVLGVLHMSFAICLQVLNHLHFNRPELIWAEFLPQILFMESIFGYLVVCIVYKWSVDWEAAGRNPPNLLNMLIQMFLSPGNVNPDDQLYRGQAFVQVFLLLLALVCVPWMLCTRPYLEYREMHKIKEQGYHGIQNGENGAHATDDETDTDGEGAHQGHAVAMTEEAEEEGHDLGEVIIHQVIHTIEFCLGCISNTASYLRLWALSLAHAQLSEVLWNMTIENAFGFEGVLAVVMLVFLFAMWFVLTIAILCVMEGLSAFLHALRLHWVEFNSKFFIGAGTAFDPLTFEGTDEIPEGVI
ncbi:V-type ATPase, V0 complex, 116kDa subunit family [Rhodotorula toruloides]|uniref:V-type proton ATPase subunit a n=1 Tax=Rhodotorula toruloides TaxID=5286 RepID=A0A2T0A6V0_RHOTO|nr:V-type ATPase, V0 complex, 116kDa subunit family [Rhodotorula toruloides]